MGLGRVPRNGIATDPGARTVLWDFTAGLRIRLSARGAGLLDCLSNVRLARSLHRGRVARPARHLHSRTSSGVAGLATESRGKTSRENKHPRLYQTTRWFVYLRGPAYDRFQLHV